jgi:hypothetical protein
MRAITVLERNRIAADRRGVHVRTWIQNPDGVMTLLDPFLGQMWTEGVEWACSVDDPVAQGTITLAREIGSGGSAISLSPLVESSIANRTGVGDYAPMVDAGRYFIVEAAVTDAGQAPLTTEWRRVFEGKVDGLELGGDVLRLDCRDPGAFLQDRVIEEDRVYGSVAGENVVQTMQRILDDNMGAQAVVLYAPVTPNWFLQPFGGPDAPGGPAGKGSNVLDALRSLAMQIGWDVRYRYDAAGNIRLTLYAPNRNATVADATFAATEYFEVPRFEINDADVRNIIRVQWQDKQTKVISSVIRSHPGSIAEFGRRYMEIGEGASSNIDTVDEATALADAALSDLAFPMAEQQVSTSFAWFVELADFYRFTANGIQFDTDQQFGLTAYQHTISVDPSSGEIQDETTLTLRGTPSGGYRSWINTRGGEFTGPSAGPVPLLGPFLGESTAFGGTTRDGCTWLAGRFSPTARGSTSGAASHDRGRRRGSCISALPSSRKRTGSSVCIVRPGSGRKHLSGRSGFASPHRPARGARSPPCRGARTASKGRSSSSPSARRTWARGQARGQLTSWPRGAQTTIASPGISATRRRTPWSSGTTSGIYLAQPGEQSFVDRALPLGSQPRYDVCHFKSGQTSPFAGQFIPPPALSGAPLWQAGYPTQLTGGGAEFRWTYDGATSSLAIQVRDTAPARRGSFSPAPSGDTQTRSPPTSTPSTTRRAPPSWRG